MLAPAIASLGPRRRRPHGSTLSRTVALGSAVPWDIRGSKEPHPLGVSGQRRLNNAASLGASQHGVDSARRVPWRGSGQRRLGTPRPLARLRSASTQRAASLGASQDGVDSARRVPWRASGQRRLGTSRPLARLRPASIRPSSERLFVISAPTQVICAMDSAGAAEVVPASC